MAQSFESGVILRRSADDAGLAVLDQVTAALRPDVEEVLQAFADLVRMGAFGGRAGHRMWPFRLDFSDASYVLNDFDRDLSNEALWVLLRMLRLHVPRRATSAALVCMGGPSQIDRLEVSRFDLPSLLRVLAMPVEFQPAGWWYTLDCDFEGSLPSDAATVLDDLVTKWVGAAAMGAFQLHWSEETPFGASIKTPAIGEDFMSWSMALPGIHPLALNSLINMLSWCA